MSDLAVAAERIWFGIAPDGTEVDVVIRVSVPMLQREGEWRAPVSLGVLESKTHNIAGVDAWQAISLAMRFAATRVADFAEDGWRFYWERGGELASPIELADSPLHSN
jgi:hypothetical protein